MCFLGLFFLFVFSDGIKCFLMTRCLNQTLNFRTSNPVLHCQDIDLMMQIPIIPFQLPQLLD